jgi:hypothetical protein
VPMRSAVSDEERSTTWIVVLVCEALCVCATARPWASCHWYAACSTMFCSNAGVEFWLGNAGGPSTERSCPRICWMPWEIAALVVVVPKQNERHPAWI